jgi:hypothetical protein
MKKIIFILVCIFKINAYSQVGIGTTTPDESAILQLESNNKGLLITRLTEEQKNAIELPANGLLIYQTDNLSGFYYFNGFIWLPFVNIDNDWIVNEEDMYNANIGNIGVGNDNPTAKLHISGSTILADMDSLSQIYSNDFSTDNINYIENSTNTCTTGNNIWHIDTLDALNAPCSSCNGERAMIRYSNLCSQDQTLILGSFTPSKETINISFDFGYNDNGISDEFIVTLFNETTLTTIETLINLTAATDSSYTASHVVTVGQNYSIKVQYIGNYDWGASIDNILVTEDHSPSNGTYLFRLEDGQEGVNKVLVSDSNGNGTWRDLNLIPNDKSDQDWLGPGVNDNNEFIYHEGTASVGRNNAIDIGLHFQVQNKESPTGTKVGLGSIEVIEDLVAEFTFNYGILPKLDDFTDIGNSTNRWRDLYLVNAPIISSDMTLKNNIKSLNHGLNTILKLNTISYQWKNEFIGDRLILEDEKETHLGFSAQQILKVMPEIVKTHSWRLLDESTPNSYTRVKHEKLGVRYTEIIPVTVKAIQEQQKMIELLNSEVSELKEIIHKLIN